MIQIDPASGIPLSAQIRTQIAGQVRFGALPGGQRLPSIRQLAADLRVAPGTVAKAYQALESEGLIETSRARGTRVAPGHGQPDEIQRAARHYVDQTRGLGLDEALSAVRAAWYAHPTAPDRQR